MRQKFVLFKRKSGVKEPLYYYYVYEEGTDRRLIRATGCKTKAEAQSYVLNHLDDLTPEKITLNDFAKDFFVRGKCPIIADLERHSKKIKDNTIRTSRQALLIYILPELGKYKICKLTHKIIDNWLISLPVKYGLKNSTCNVYLSKLRIILDRAVTDGIIKVNPSLSVKPLGNDGDRTEAFTLDEIHSALSYPWDNEMIKLCCKLSSLTGMRIGEVLGLKVEDIEEGKITIKGQIQNKVYTTPKNGKERTVSIPEGLNKELKEMAPSSSGYVFRIGCGDNTPITVHTVQDNLKKVLDKLNIKNKSFHSFRAFFNTYMVSSGLEGDLLRSVIGHSGEEMTDHYMHLESADLSKVRKLQEEILKD